MKLRFLMTACAAVVLTACQTAGTTSYSGDEPSAEGKLFGEYLAGSYANYLEDSGARSEYYSRAFARAEDDIPLGKDKKESMALTLLGEKAFKQGRLKQAQALFNPDTSDLTMAIAMGLMEGWSYVAANDMEKARETFRSVGGGTYFQNLADLQIAKAEALKGNVDAAKVAFKVAEENGQSAIETGTEKWRKH